MHPKASYLIATRLSMHEILYYYSVTGKNMGHNYSLMVATIYDAGIHVMPCNWVLATSA